MSHNQERLRRFSYAGLTKLPLPDQKTRRISDGGHFRPKINRSNFTTADLFPNFTLSSGSSSTNNSSTSLPSAMLHDALNSTTRYDSNKNRRPSRRMSRVAEEPFTCSQQSVLSAMDRFVIAVNNMNSTVLLPSRLQDIDVENGNNQLTRCLHSNMNNVDVYAFYNMLKGVKNELLWGPTTMVRNAPVPPMSGRTSPYSSSNHVPMPSINGRTSPNSSSNHVTTTKNAHKSSDESLGSIGFSSDQEMDSDVESVLTDKDSIEEQNGFSGSHLASAFRRHLLGLHTILNELADSADYLSSRYQEELDNVL